MLKRTSYIGIDFGASSIKIVEFKKSGKKNIELVRAHQSLIPREAIANLQKDFSPVVFLIRQMLLEMGIPSAEAIISLPNQFAFSRFIKLPPVMSSKIGQIIEYEAQQQVPFPIETVVWDYQILPQQTLAIETEVVLCAIEKRILSSFLEAVTPIVSVDAIDVGSLSYYNFVHTNADGNGVVYIDIGAATTILLVYEGTKFWSRNLPLAGNEITETIKNELRVGFQEAEQIKKNQGLTEEETGVVGKVNHCITVTLQRLIAEIQRSIGYYRSQSKDIIIEKIVVSGGTANLSGLTTFIEKNIGIKTVKLDFAHWLKLSPKSQLQDLRDFDPAYAIACGLATRTLGRNALKTNLLPHELVRERGMRKRQAYFYTIAVLGCLTMFVLYLGITQKKARLKTKVNLINRIVLECRDCEKMRQDIEATIRPLIGQLAGVERLIEYKHTWLNVMAYIGEIIPKSFWIESLKPVSKRSSENAEPDIQDRRASRRQRMAAQRIRSSDGQLFLRQFLIKGRTTGNFVDVDHFKNLLSELPYFQYIKVEMAVGNTQNDIIQFEIYAELSDESIESIE